MARLPQPATTSPGFLQLTYNNSIVTHKVSVRVIAGVDITAISAMRTAAGALADLVKAAVPNTVAITGWKILNPARIELYGEPFSPIKTGTFTPGSGVVHSDSCTIDLMGKGVPPVGQAQGKTRFELFVDYWTPNYLAAQIDLSGAAPWAALVAELNGSAVYGADIFGTKAVFTANADLQINAHYQKRYGF